MTVTINGTTGITSPAIDVTTPITVADGGTGLTSVGASGNVLTSDGTSWVSSAPSGGVTSFNGNTGALAGWQLVTSGTFTSASTINITGLPSGYKAFKLVFNGSHAGGSNLSNFFLRVSTNNGSSYLSTLIYNYTNSTAGGTIGGDAFYPAPGAAALQSGGSYLWDIDIFQSSNSRYTTFQGSTAYTTTSAVYAIDFLGQATQTSYVNALQITRDGSTGVVTGYYQIYGSQ